ncbi:hypothetical protein SCAR479_07962 [Seiridium cardinale]|uniref:Rhodopsin domain-containing protein n=1 Tax=Seiridium cardinale TaxID=138064 RepID=A0ABR2XNU6_9PEZI
MSNTKLPGWDDPDENRGNEILGAVATTTLLALITVCGRLYVRLRMVHMFGADDWVMISAMTLSLAGLGVVIPEVMNGAGRHTAYLDPETNRLGLKLNFITQPIYLWAIPLVKVSVGLFLMKISPNLLYRRILQGIILFLMVYTVASFLTLVLHCQDLSALWDNRVQTYCWPNETIVGLGYSYSTINVVTDLFFALIPIPMLWNIQIDRRTKASLICVLGLGIFATAAAIIKFAYLSNYGKNGDFLWDSANLTIWFAIELNIGIIAACLPCLKPVFRHAFKGTSRRYNSKNQTNSYKLRTFGSGSGPGPIYGRSFVTTQIEARNPSFIQGMGDESQENILIGANLAPDAITKTTVVIVDRSDLGDQPELSGWPRKTDTNDQEIVDDWV